MAVNPEGPKIPTSNTNPSEPSRDQNVKQPSLDPALGIAEDHATPEIKKYEAMLNRNHASRVFATLAELYRKQGRLDEAISLCLKGLKFHPDYISGRVVLGRAYFDKGMLKEAAHELEQVIALNPNHLLANKILGDVFLVIGDIAKARSRFESVMRIAPEDLEVKKKLEPINIDEASPIREAADRPDMDIIEGQSLKIVTDSPPSSPTASEQSELPEDSDDEDIELTLDEISEILIGTEKMTGEIRAIFTPPPADTQQATHPPQSVPSTFTADAPGPLYSAVQSLQVGIVITDLDGVIHYTNPAAARMHELTPDETIGRNLAQFFPPGLFLSMTMHEILEKKSLARDTLNVTKAGTAFPVRITHDIVEGENKEPLFIINSIVDLTMHREVNEALWQLSIKDSQTGLFNRRHFVTKLMEERRRAERMGYPFCLLIFTVKDLTSYLRIHGDKAGEKLLAEIGRLTRRSIRKEVDSAYRLGDDEFGVILPTATADKARVVIDRLRTAARKKLPDFELMIGIASSDDYPITEELIAAAEKGMYL